MDIVTLVLILLLAVVASGIVSRVLPVPLPMPLVQIVLGGAIGLSTNYRVVLDPDLFMLLFLPPLLFLDGWRLPKDALRRDIATIGELALGLVLFTVVGAGFLLHWMIPAMPLAVAFALAAVVSPTDPIAVSSIAARVPVPPRMMHILEGESLLNDASGLVCLRFAIAAAVTGQFSLAQAGVQFLWMAAGGLASGAAIALLVARANAWFSARFGDEGGSQILVTLLLPFGCYLVGEHIGASGILAAVAAGITMTFAELGHDAPAAIRLRRNSVWDMIQFALNGVIFVLLGEQIPRILGGASIMVRLTGHQASWWLAVYVVALTAALMALRFVWTVVSFKLTLLRGRRSDPRRPGWRLFAAVSVAGVRGAVTLAGVLTLPIALADGSPFPARNLAIALAGGVILLSLVVASIALPLLLGGLEMPAETDEQHEEDAARVATAKAAIAAIRDAVQAPAHADDAAFAETAEQLIALYERRVGEADDDAAAQETAAAHAAAERALRLAATHAERDAIRALSRQRRISSTVARRLARELDLAEVRLSG